jgi:translation initiation factor IF-1
MPKVEDVVVNTWTYVRVANGEPRMSFVLGSQRIHMNAKIAEDFAVKLTKAAERIRKSKVTGKTKANADE